MTHGIAAQKGETCSLVVAELDGYNDIAVFITKYTEGYDLELMNLRIKYLLDEIMAEN